MTPHSIEISAPAHRRSWVAAASLLGIAAAAFVADPGHGAAGGLAMACRWLVLMLVPGWALYRFVARGNAGALETALSAILVSPVIVAVGAVAGLGAGTEPRSIASLLAAVFVTAAIVACLIPGASARRRPSRREVAVLVLLFGVLAVLTAYLPLTREWWRVRSDAWFHAAVVKQIAHYGIPPQDPYFVGMPLQYMWFYHALVLVLSRSLAIDAFWVMALVNVQALAGLAVAAWHLASVFRERVGDRFAAAATLLLAFNGAFWIFLPVKLVRSFTGDVRGLDEIARNYSLSPFTYSTASNFLIVYYNQEFFLDKFMVATAFGLALAFMTAAWASSASFVATRRRSELLILAAAVIGMLGFHSLVGFVMLVGIFGGAIPTGILGRRTVLPPRRDVLLMLAVALGCFLAMTPYLYAVMHAKEREQVIPLNVSFTKTVGIFISSAFVVFMTWRARSFRTGGSVVVMYFLLAAVSVTIFCLLIKLPGPNTYDKLGFFVFIPFAIPAGFAVADSVRRRRPRSRWLVAGVWAVLFYLPVNTIAIASCFFTPSLAVVTPEEARLSAWAAENTPRDAVIVDDHDRAFLLVTGPRRYLCGSWAYAQQWGYPREEMSRRFHARSALYRAAPLDVTTLDVLSSVEEPLFAVARPEHRVSDAAVVSHPELFHRVYDAGALSLYRIDRDACRRAISTALPAVPTEELIRESGL